MTQSAMVDFGAEWRPAGEVGRDSPHQLRPGQMGEDQEWTGLWSDDSREWKELSQEERQSLELTVAPDGEWWRVWSHFRDNFDRVDRVDICHSSLETRLLLKVRRYFVNEPVSCTYFAFRLEVRSFFGTFWSFLVSRKGEDRGEFGQKTK